MAMRYSKKEIKTFKSYVALTEIIFIILPFCFRPLWSTLNSFLKLIFQHQLGRTGFYVEESQGSGNCVWIWFYVVVPKADDQLQMWNGLPEIPIWQIELSSLLLFLELRQRNSVSPFEAFLESLPNQLYLEGDWNKRNVGLLWLWRIWKPVLLQWGKHSPNQEPRAVDYWVGDPLNSLISTCFGILHAPGWLWWKNLIMHDHTPHCDAVSTTHIRNGSSLTTALPFSVLLHTPNYSGPHTSG